MDDNEYIRQLEQAAALPDWIARKKAYLRINLRRLDTMVQEQASVVLASKTNVANASLDGLKAAAEKLAADAADFDAQYEYQEGRMDTFDRAEAAFRCIFDVKKQ